MFGESYICGKKDIKIDDRGRFILPQFTYVEPKEEVMFMISESMEYFNIFSKNDIFNKLNALTTKQNKASSCEEFNTLQTQINVIQSYCYGFSEVDEQRRVLIPKPLREKIISGNDIFVSGNIALQIPCLEVYQSEKQMLAMDIRRKNFI